MAVRKEEMAMHFYHIDRKNSFKAKQEEQFVPIPRYVTQEEREFIEATYNSKISKIGGLYLGAFDDIRSNPDELTKTCENYRVYCIEYIFEIVRMMYFPQLPSRFQSVYACQTKDDVKTWYNLLNQNGAIPDNATVIVLNATNGFFIGDSQWRDRRHILQGPKGEPLSVFSSFWCQAQAMKYWEGTLTDKPQTEVLCKLPVTIVESIPLSEFLSGLM